MSGGTKFLLDSYNRSRGTPGEYDIELFTPIKDVTRVDLVSAYVPKTMYAIVEGVSDILIVFHFDDAATPKWKFAKVEIEERNYSGTELAAEIQEKVRAITGFTPLHIRYNSNTNSLFALTEQNLPDDGWLIPADQSAASLGLTAISGSSSKPPTPAIARVLGLQNSGTASTALVADVALATGDADVFGVWVAPASQNEPVLFPSMVDMSFPRYLFVDISFGNSFENSILSTENSYSLIIPFGDSNHLDIENFTVASDFPQILTLATVNLKFIHVKWRWPEPAQAIVDFRGAESQLLFEAFSA